MSKRLIIEKIYSFGSANKLPKPTMTDREFKNKLKEIYNGNNNIRQL